MPDPFERLHAPVTPIDPDPTFAARLRARLERALALPRGVPVTAIDLAPEPVTIVPRARGAAIPYLAVGDGRRAIEWYVEVLGARRLGEPVVMDDGRVGHAELEFAGGLMYLADSFPEIGHVAPTAGAASVSLVLEVADVDRIVARAVAAGAELTREVGEGHGSRNATILDPFGHRWMLQTPLPAASGAGTLVHGDLAYTSLQVPDADRAAVFFAAVLGWEYDGDPAPGHARHVVGATPAQGIFGGQERSTMFACYAVDDLDDALARVDAAGGDAGAPSVEPHGRVADCVDDQGTPFALVEIGSVAAAPPTRPTNGLREGDLAYATFEVRDSARARAFYGEVLGWRFTPGRVGDGWQIPEVAPMAGLHGGHEVATGVPMFRVDDVAAAVERVRAAGGTATEPERQPYGVTSDCVDDQGTRFSLGEM